MKIIAITFLIAIIGFSNIAMAEIKTVTHTIQQTFGGSQSPDDARTAGIARAKREALEQFGTYIESTTIVKNSQVDSDEILALTAGVTKAEVIKQINYTDGDGFGLEITVKVDLDTSVLEKSLKRLIEDRSHLKDLKAIREREKILLVRIADLEKQNQKKGKTKQESAILKNAFHAASNGLSATEWFNKAIDVINEDRGKTIEYLTNSIRLDPNYVEAYQFRGITYLNLNQSENTIKDFDQAIRLKPNDDWLYQLRGFAYFRFKQFDKAIEDFSQLIRIKPNESNGYIQRAYVYGEQKQWELSISDNDQIIRLEPNNVSAYLNRGVGYEKLHKLEKAIINFSEVISRDERHASAYEARGFSYLGLEKYVEGCADLKTACNLGECGRYKFFSKLKVCN